MLLMSYVSEMDIVEVLYRPVTELRTQVKLGA